ncbi:unnamed protein product, partial [Vitis vinifera]
MICLSPLLDSTFWLVVALMLASYIILVMIKRLKMRTLFRWTLDVSYMDILVILLVHGRPMASFIQPKAFWQGSDAKAF